MAPGLQPEVEGLEEEAEVRGPADQRPIDRRTLQICAWALLLALAGVAAAEALMALIGLVTNVLFHGRVAFDLVSPAGGRGGWWILLVPVAGALVIGAIARFGSAAIRGHGIPEVMEKAMFEGSRIPLRVTFLKPLSAAIAIGTGGPFGAEGPIIATGGAIGSLIGQRARFSARERRTLLAAGAAAGMAATFGSPVSSVLLVVELLLFEYRPRSLIPVALAAALATCVRIAIHGTAPVFPIPDLQPAGPAAFGALLLLGAAIGGLAALVTRATYGIEDLFERLPVHWMWWPAIGAVVVGLVGLVEPRTLGVGYDNITDALSGSIAGRALLLLVIAKFVSWSIYLGSGTSGGTLAPLFTFGGGLGALVGALLQQQWPGLGVTPAMGGLVGMAAMFTGASHAPLASVVFAFETTRQPAGLVPLLGGCAAAYLVALLCRPHSIMTEKLARRGTHVRLEYGVDELAHVPVRRVATRAVVTLAGSRPADEARAWLLSGRPGSTHQGFPVLDDDGRLLGVITRRQIVEQEASATVTVADLASSPAIVVFEDGTVREAVDQMAHHRIGRVPVVRRDDPHCVVGILSRSDLLSAYAGRMQQAHGHDVPEDGAAVPSPS
ncbi:MAG TPA: chloride channel protein [Planctomycetota bacterium]|nr:chloride channel protein [Planctomycetota bacterium]